MDINPYTPPQARIDDVAVHAVEPSAPHDISISELAAFAGDSKYPRRWLARHENRSRFAGFNVWAAVFGMQWFFFRKLHFQGLLSLFLEAGVPFLLTIAAINAIGKGPVTVLLSVLFIVATRVAIGFWANLALYSEAVRTIRRVDNSNLDNEAHLREIAKAGGVSVPSLIAAYALLAALRFAFPNIW